MKNTRNLPQNARKSAFSLPVKNCLNIFVMPMVTCHKVVRTVQKQRDKRKKEREKHLFDVCFIEGERKTPSILLTEREKHLHDVCFIEGERKTPLRRLFHLKRDHRYDVCFTEGEKHIYDVCFSSCAQNYCHTKAWLNNSLCFDLLPTPAGRLVSYFRKSRPNTERRFVT